MDEIIICAAIHYDDNNHHLHQPRNITTGIVICGLRHHNCFAILAEINGVDWMEGYSKSDNKITQGFLTSEDRFVGRQEAAEIAFRVGQTTKQEDTLYSEDLY